MRKMRLFSGLAQVEEAPVHALVQAGVRGDRRLADRPATTSSDVDLDLDPAELDALVVLELAGDGEEACRASAPRSSSASADRHAGIAVLEAARVHQLDRTGLVAEDDELHLLLVAHGLDPSGYRHRPVGEAARCLIRVRSLTSQV